MYAHFNGSIAAYPHATTCPLTPQHLSHITSQRNSYNPCSCLSPDHRSLVFLIFNHTSRSLVWHSLDTTPVWAASTASSYCVVPSALARLPLAVLIMNDSFTFPPPNLSCKPLKLTEVAAHSDVVNCISVGRWSSSVIVTGGDDCRVNCWKVGKLTPTLSLAGHTTPVDSVCFDAREDLVAGGSRGGSIKVWDCKSERLCRTLTGHRSAVTALDFHPFGDYFASGSTDTNVKLWDVKRKGCMQTYKGHEAAVTRVIFSPDGRWVVSGDVSGAVRVWDVTAGKPVHEIRGARREPIVSFHFHPNELLLATASTHNISLHDLDHFRLLSTTPREATTIRYALFDPDGTALVSVQPDSCRTWSNWDTPHCYDSCEGRWDGAYDVSISRNKELVVASKAKNMIRVDLVDLTVLAPYKQRNDQENMPMGAGLGIKVGQARGGKTGGGVDEWSIGKSDHGLPAQPRPHSPLPATPPPPATAAATNVTSATPSTDPRLSRSPKLAKSSILASPNAAFFRAHAAASLVAVPPQQQQQQQPATQPPVVSGWPAAAAGRASAPVEQKASLVLPTFEQQLLSPISSHSSASSVDASRQSFATPQSAISPQPAPTTSTLIPSQPTHPLNLSFSSFLPAPSASPPPPLPSLDSDAIRDRLLEQHDLTLRALSHRRQNLHTLVSLWCTPPSASSASAAIRTLCATLVTMNDQLVAADFLQSTWPQFSNQPLLTLECALLLLPLLRSMLSSKYERCVLVAMRYTQLIVGSFGQLVRDSRRAGGGGVDVVGEERRQRCDGVWRELQAVSSVLVGLKGSKDVVESARQLTAALHDVVEV